MLPVAAHLPQPVVRLGPVGLQELQQVDLQRPGVVIAGQAGLPGERQPVERLAPDVQLQLLGRGVADAHRRRALVAGQPGQLQLGNPPAAGQPVHDLQVGRVAGDGAQQPVPPLAGLGDEPGAGERLQGERGVAQPAVAVVPVAGAADLLRQARRRRGHDSAGGVVGERLEHDQRAADLALPRAVVVALGHPVGPPGLGLVQGRVRLERLGRALPRAVPGQHERHALALRHGELRVGGKVPPDQRGRRGQPGRVRPGHGDHLAVDPANPGHHLAVVEPEPEHAVHRHRAGDALDDPHDVRRLVTWRHAVDHPDGAVRGLPERLQHERVAPVLPVRAGAAGGRREQPVPVLVVAEQRGEAGRRVEVRQAQPVDRPVPADQRRRVQVAQQRIVLDPATHHVFVPSAAARRACSGDLALSRGRRGSGRPRCARPRRSPSRPGGSRRRRRRPRRRRSRTACDRRRRSSCRRA